MLTPKKYYKLYEDSSKKKEYQKLLKALSNKTDSRDYFKLNSSNKLYYKREKLHEEIKRFVPKKEVKETFNKLFSHFNLLYQGLFKKTFSIHLWYNGSDVNNAMWFSSILNGDKISNYIFTNISEKMKYFQKKDFILDG